MDLLSDISEYEAQHLCEHERRCLNEYKAAVESNNVSFIDFMSKLGPTVRHRVMNLDKFRVNLMFGYDSIQLTEYDWIESPELLNREEIAFKVKSDNCHYNHINIGHGLNGKWSYGYNYTTPMGSGGGSGLHTDRQLCFDTREDCIMDALDWMLYRLKTSGCNSSYTKKIIELVNAENSKYSDVKVDKKGQVLLF